MSEFWVDRNSLLIQICTMCFLYKIEIRGKSTPFEWWLRWQEEVNAALQNNLNNACKIVQADGSKSSCASQCDGACRRTERTTFWLTLTRIMQLGEIKHSRLEFLLLEIFTTETKHQACCRRYIAGPWSWIKVRSDLLSFSAEIETKFVKFSLPLIHPSLYMEIKFVE